MFNDCYCRKCGSDVNNPRLGPRKVLQSGGLFSSPVYDLGVCTSHSEYAEQVSFYYYLHDLFCPKCGCKVGEMNKYHDGCLAREFGEIASDDAVTRYFRYCYSHPDAEQNIYIGTQYGYPGNIV